MIAQQKVEKFIYLNMDDIQACLSYAQSLCDSSLALSAKNQIFSDIQMDLAGLSFAQRHDKADGVFGFSNERPAKGLFSQNLEEIIYV